MNPLPLGTHMFSFSTAAPVGSVWELLTCGSETPKYFHGLEITSSWTVGDPIWIRGPLSDPEHGAVLTGHVLCALPPHRLSFSFHSGTDDPHTYLTWELRPSTSGTIVQLQVDHIEHVDELSEAEDTWLPVLAALQALLSADGEDGPPST